MKKLLLRISLFVLIPSAAFAQAGPSPGAACGKSGTPCYSRPTGNPVTLTDHSGSITLGGTAQQVLAPDANRSHCEIANLSTYMEWLNDTGTASAGPGSWPIPPGSDRLCDPSGISTGAFSLFGPNTGQQFTLKSVD